MGGIRAMSPTLRPVYYVPAAVLLVFVSVVVTLLFSSYAPPSTQQRALSWTTGISAAGVSAVVAILGYLLNREAAIRSATIEAQKMLLEINKQYLISPKLLYIEGEYAGAVDLTDTTFNAQLRAMAYLKLNVFEVIFAVLPAGSERETWLKYFESSLSKSVLLADELERNHDIYHTALIDAYDGWKKRQGSAGSEALANVVNTHAGADRRAGRGQTSVGRSDRDAS
jgi:hypothetical protein